MHEEDHMIICSQCGKKLGLLRETVSGSSHTMGIKMCCMECLPEQIEKMEKDSYKPEEVKRIKRWLKTKQRAMTGYDPARLKKGVISRG